MCVYIFPFLFFFLRLSFLLLVLRLQLVMYASTRMLLKNERRPPRRPLPIQRHRPSSSAKSLTNARVYKEREEEEEEEKKERK